MVKQHKKRPNDARVYSYIRFSTPEQRLGDSERRQLSAAKDFAEKEAIPFDESLRMDDRGLSGFHGTNLKKGALGQFLESVKRGDVPPGSVLVVENVDRLSRLEFTEAFKIISGIIDGGITIRTLAPEATYDRDALNNYGIYQLTGQIQLAHDDSKKKSERLSAVWSEKKRRARDGEVLTRRLPAWLRLEKDKIVPIPEAVKAIRKIFEMKAGGIGKGSIAKHLNAKGYWTPPPRRNAKTSPSWRDSYITKILSNRAVIGEYQPHKLKDEKRIPDGEPVENFFPVVVKPDLFYVVQKTLQANRGSGGQTGKAENFFAGIVRCAYCGGPMHFISKGRPPKGAGYLVCDAGRRGAGCDRKHRTRYDEIENIVLKNCHRLRPEEVLPNPNEAEAQCRALREKLAGIDGVLRDNESRRQNLMEQIEHSASDRTRRRYEKRLDELDASDDSQEAQRKETTTELRQAESASQSFSKWKASLKDLVKELSNGDVEIRLRLRAHLKELIDYIEIFTHGFTKAHDPDARREDNEDSESLGEYISAVAYEAGVKLPAGFEDWATQQAMGKAGRFCRIHFKSGARVDVAPEGSLAEHCVWEGGKKWRYVRPDLNKLLRAYRRSQNS
ncbi:MAG: recombinase family protein [Phycisphaerae bacterium]|nr:recombinase family protein [Phycisphaerae bacterium]